MAICWNELSSWLLQSYVCVPFPCCVCGRIQKVFFFSSRSLPFHLLCRRGSLIVEYDLVLDNSTEAAEEAMLAMLTLLGTEQIEVFGQNVSATSLMIEGYIGIILCAYLPLLYTDPWSNQIRALARFSQRRN